MLQAKRILLALLLMGGMTSTAFAAATGNGSALNVLSGTYNSTLPTLTPGQSTSVQVDTNGRIITAPASLIFASPLQTYGGGGVGADIAFPATVSTNGTSLGALPLGASRLQIHLPVGSSVSIYVSPVIVASAVAAALVASTYNNAAANTNNLDVNIDLNGEQVWVTNYTVGTASTFISGKPVYRFQ
jgi:hypothetical protein